jgi:hypothetical protein
LKKPKLTNKITSISKTVSAVAVEELKSAELAIIKVAQSDFFADEITKLKQGQRCSNSARENERSDRQTSLKGLSRFSKLDPFLDPDSIISLGGRIQHASLSDQVKYPIILPRKCHVTEMVIRFYHGRVAHQGRGLTTNAIRSLASWSLVVVRQCLSSYLSVLYAGSCDLLRKVRKWLICQLTVWNQLHPLHTAGSICWPILHYGKTKRIEKIRSTVYMFVMPCSTR